jgi:hypothetical protein
VDLRNWIIIFCTGIRIASPKALKDEPLDRAIAVKSIYPSGDWKVPALQGRVLGRALHDEGKQIAHRAALLLRTLAELGLERVAHSDRDAHRMAGGRGSDTLNIRLATMCHSRLERWLE